MMFCRNCGNELPSGALYCPSCGRPVDFFHDGLIANDTVLAPIPSKHKRIKVITAVIIAFIVIIVLSIVLLSSYNPEYKVEICNGEYITSSTGSGTYGFEIVTVSATVEEGHSFLGWFDSNGNCLSSDLTYRFRAKDITLYPKGANGVKITIIKGLGVDSASGEGIYAADSYQKLDAQMLDGYELKGWYSVESDSFLTKNSQGKYNIGNGGTIAAVSDTDRYKGTQTLSITPEKNYESCCWLIIDHWTHNYVASVRDSPTLNIEIAPGRYDITASGISSGIWDSETTTVYLKGTIDNQYSYKYKTKQYGADWRVDYSLIDSYYSKKTGRHPSYSHMSEFVEYDSKTITDLASALNEQSGSMKENDQANFVLSFVHQITSYELDERYNGSKEYWKYPVETLFDRRGDCEDTSVLYAAIMKAMGYDVVLLIYDSEEYTGRGHAAVGVALENVYGGTYYEKDGKKYYYCETSGNGWRVGEATEDYDECKIIKIS